MANFVELKWTESRAEVGRVSSRYKDDFTVVKSEIEEAIAMYEELKERILEDTEKRTGVTTDTE